ncbi:MAG: VOC family protein [Anaerolineae bacterium]|nr:VOC family protein [Anaerolineae bacterium]
MKAEQVLETCLYVDDLDAAERFYTDVLGLESFSRVEDRHLFFRCGSGVFLLFNPARTVIAEGDVPTHGAHGPGHVAFSMTADDIPKWREQLLKHNIPIETEFTWPSGGYSLYFRDPAGNSIELTTPKTWGL